MKMKVVEFKIDTDGDFRYDSLFKMYASEDERHLFERTMDNLKVIGESMESSRHNISSVKNAILSFTNAYFNEGKLEYFDHKNEMYFSKESNYVEIGIWEGNWSFVVDNGLEMEISQTPKGIAIK